MGFFSCESVDMCFKNKNLDQVKVGYDCGYGESQFYEKETKGPVNIGLKNSSKKKNH